ncbi:uridine phosphorylase 1-like [Haliotis rufescens]|uniref:uridine phosphorylase 1-like n=1 Tax=Haliotis rufescens TaxID=6454 RepID=UPI00201F7BB3|nr:uridine phosphorylase 1-like [Haliotis rufescens]
MDISGMSPTRSFNNPDSARGEDYHPQDGPIKIQNPHIATMEEDYLYHIALGDKTHDLHEMFNDVKFVCFGGSPTRMLKFAEFMKEQLRIKIPAGMTLYNIANGSDRYVIYKTGPVLSVSHGIGIPSLSIIMHEILKLLQHAECSGVTLFRIGTSGGLGLEAGSVVITSEAVDGNLRQYMEVAIMGMVVKLPSFLDKELCQELLAMASEDDHFQTIIGKTMCTHDFYEGQARLDGAFCDYTQADKMAFLRRIHDKGIRNIEMESLCFAAYCHRANIRGAVICVTLLDSLNGDQITTPHNVMEEWNNRPQQVVARLIKKKLGISDE